MKKKSYGTWILLVCTVSVVIWAYFFEFKKKQKDEALKEQEALVLQIKKEDIAKFSVGQSKEKFTLENKNGNWKVTAPIQDDADPISVNQFLDAVTKEKAEMEISDDLMEPKVYGLEQPRAVFEFESKVGKTTKIEIGDEAVQGKHYLRVDSGKAVVVSSNQWQILAEKNLPELRAKNIFRGGEIQSVEVEAQGKPKVLLVQKEGKWELEGARFNLDIPAIKAFIGQVQNLHVLSVQTEDQKQLNKYGLEAPAVVLRVQTKDNKDPEVIRISTPRNKEKEVFVVNSSLKPIYKAAGSLAQSLSKKPMDFRDRDEPFRFTLADVIGVRTKSPQFDFRFIKKGEAWYLEKPDPARDVDQTQLMMLLTSIQGAKVHEYLDKVPFKSERQIELLDKEGNNLLKIEVGEEIKGKNRRLLKTSKAEQVVSVDSMMIDSWPGPGLVKEKAATK